MDLAQLVRYVIESIKPYEPGRQDIVDALNEVIKELALNMEVPFVWLNKRSTVTIHPGHWSCSMPHDYMRNMVVCTDQTTKKDLEILPSFKEMEQRAGVFRSGDPEMVAVEEQTLHYNPSPASARKLEIGYNAYPKPLVEDSDKIEFLPAGYTGYLLVDAASVKLLGKVQGRDKRAESLVKLIQDRHDRGLKKLQNLPFRRGQPRWQG